MRGFTTFLMCALVAVAVAAPAHAVKPTKVLGDPAAGIGTIKHQDYNHVLSADTVYVLKGIYMVDSTYSLTIPAGTLMLGDSLSAGTLYIQRGAQIFAEGTECCPIVMTSGDPRGRRERGDWGGVIIAGEAPINQQEPPIEGGIVPGSYGGPGPGRGDGDPNDDSGVFRYVRLEYPGFRFADKNEINGLTLCGVGAGTTIDHVQVSYSFDDAYEWFGGRVDAKYLVAFGTTDDDFDTDFGYQGGLQYLFGLKDPFIWDVAGETRGFESDNQEPSLCVEPRTWPVISNLTSIGPFRVDTIALPIGERFDWSGVVRRCSHLECYNSAFIGHERGLSVRDDTTHIGAFDDSTFRHVSVASFERDHDTGRWPAILRANGEPGWSPDSIGVVAWFDTMPGNFRPAYLGGIIRLPSTMGLTNMHNLNDPNPVPQVGTELDTYSVDFSHLDPAFFESTDYRGAFIPGVSMDQQWTAGWTNFDPQNTPYNEVISGIGDSPRQSAYFLGQNQPNPFRSVDGTTIHYSVAKAGKIQINIFDVAGRLVNTISDNAKAGGNFVTWDGKSREGAKVATGVYFYQIKTDGWKAQKKMLMVN